MTSSEGATHARENGPPAGQRVAIVAGGAGSAGSAVVMALLAAGTAVVVPSRSADRLRHLSDGIPAGQRSLFHPVVGDLTADPDDLRGRILDAVGRLDVTVASLGAWWEGAPLVDVDLQTWDKILTDNLTSHFLTARTFLPLLADRPGSVYLTLNGVGAAQPVVGSGPISITGAAQYRMLEMLKAECARQPVRFHEVRIMAPIVRYAGEPSDSRVPTVTRQQVGEFVVHVLDPSFERADSLLLEFAAPDGAPPASSTPAEPDDGAQQGEEHERAHE